MTRYCRSQTAGSFRTESKIIFLAKDALAVVQTRDPRPVEHGDVYEDVLRRRPEQ